MPNCSWKHFRLGTEAARNVKEKKIRTHCSIHVVEVPDLAEDGSIVYATEVRNGTGLGLDNGLEVIKLVGGLVGRDNASAGRNIIKPDISQNEQRGVDVRGKEFVGREELECPDNSFKVINDLSMFDIILSIAGDVKGRSAGSVLGELSGNVSHDRFFQRMVYL